MEGIRLVELNRDDRKKPVNSQNWQGNMDGHYLRSSVPIRSASCCRNSKVPKYLDDIAANGYIYHIVYESSKPAGYFAVKPEPDKAVPQ